MEETFPIPFDAIQDGEAGHWRLTDLYKSAAYPHGTKAVSATILNKSEYDVIHRESGLRVPSKLSKNLEFPGGFTHLSLQADGGTINAGELVAEITVDIPEGR